MKAYDPSCPLVFIHVPKTAGSSVRRIFTQWFGERFVPHYFDEANGTPPQRSPLFDQHSPELPVCVYGHFNRKRGFGVQDNYPDARQFMTVLRDPFEMAISGYYFMRNTGAGWKDKSNLPDGELAASLERFSVTLGCPFEAASLERRNAAKRDEQNEAVQGLRMQFRERHSLEFDVYDYARARFAPQGQSSAAPEARP